MLNRTPKKRKSRSSKGKDRIWHSPSPSHQANGSGRSTPAEEDSRHSSPLKDSPSNTPSDGRSLASLSTTGSITPSTSAMDALGLSSVPSLPLMVTVRSCELEKRPPTDPVSGWGFVLRGTTSEFRQGIKVYTCHVDSVKQYSAAMQAGIKEGDQIVEIEGIMVRDLEHTNVVRMFQSKDRVKLVILPAKYKSSVQVRITDYNQSALNYLWALTMHIQSLEIINVNLGEERPEFLKPASFCYLLGLRHLAINHCLLEDLACLEGIKSLHKLESLSLAHNLLSNDSISSNCCLSGFSSLKKLDLSFNLLSSIPPVVFSISNLETLVLVENNITDLPTSLTRLTKLSTLCLDGNLLCEVDRALEQLEHQLSMVTLAYNQIETEPQCIKNQAYVITCVEGNPYLLSRSNRDEPALKRALSVRGLVKSSNNHISKRTSLVLSENSFSMELLSPTISVRQ